MVSKILRGLVFLTLCLEAIGATAENPPKQKVAEGQYARLKDNVRIQGSEQKWVMWRLADGGFELEDHFQMQADPAARLLSIFPQSKLSLGLRSELAAQVAQTDLIETYSFDWRLQTVRVLGKKLIDGKAVEVLKCNSAEKQVRCHGKESVKQRIGNSSGFFYAFPFPMIFSGWFARSKTTPEQTSTTKVVALDGIVDARSKLNLVAAEAKLELFPDEVLTIGDHQFQSHRGKITFKVENKSALQVTIWYGKPGLIYAVESRGGPAGERMALIEYKKYQEL